MEPAAIKRQLRNFIVENFLFGQDGNFQESDSFLQVGILDSTGVLQLVSFLESTYGITVEEGELTPDNLDSISNIVAFLGKKLGGKQQAGGPGTETAAGGGNE